MALAVRRGDLKRSEVHKSVLDIVDSDMTDQEIRDFTVLKESMRPLSEYINEALRLLGKGEEGKVYDLGDGRVKKVFKRGRVPMTWQLLMQAQQMGVKTLSLPTVYKVGPDYVIREACTPNTKKCRDFYRVTMSKPFTNEDILYRMILADRWKYDDKTDSVVTGIKMSTPGILGEVIGFLCHLKYELTELTGHPSLGDFKPENLGETKDGRVVMMDF